jgi:L-alanine-DL-glutamate epimerase-like enolase superfamily enzyme
MTHEEIPVEPDGNVVVPRRAGIGVSLNRATLEKYHVA